MHMSIRFVILFFFIAVTTIWGQLSPGKLSNAHADLEGIENCTQCHTAGKAVDAFKCLKCHTFIKERLAKGKGLHANPEFKQCQKCHHEHFGRHFSLIHWENGKPDIDHAKTGWKLLGNHQKVKCRDCHNPRNIAPVKQQQLQQQHKDLERTFLGLDTRCLSCHQDEHRGQLSKDCLNCHTMDGWKPAQRFDHNKARFRLTGAHVRIQCTACHKARRDNRYPDNPTYVQFTGLKFNQCTGCHQDFHRGKFGGNCQKCHNTRSWQQVQTAAFNHNRTRFPLVGMHQKVPCQKCHPGKGTQRFRGLKFNHCRDCHTDYHQGQFSTKLATADCDICHTEAGFRPSKFSVAHHQKTQFPLTGAHGAVPCRNCHRPIRAAHGKTLQFSFNSLSCRQCHTNVHGQEIQPFLKEKGCQRCHTTESWSSVTFDHSQTDFPLTGVHQQVSCTHCHQAKATDSQRQILFSQASKLCQSCHQEPHQQQFAQRVTVQHRTVLLTRCERCHTTQDWHSLIFDHNRDSRFKLEGAHATVGCQQCHPAVQGNPSFVRYKPLDSRCQACHGNTQEKRS